MSLSANDIQEWSSMDSKPFEEECAVCLIKASCIKFPSTEIMEGSLQHRGQGWHQIPLRLALWVAVSSHIGVIEPSLHSGEQPVLLTTE